MTLQQDMPNPPHRVVMVVKDQSSPLWFITCADREDCPMRCRSCWLGSAMSERGGREYALRLGYTLAGKPQP